MIHFHISWFFFCLRSHLVKRKTKQTSEKQQSGLISGWTGSGTHSAFQGRLSRVHHAFSLSPQCSVGLYKSHFLLAVLQLSCCWLFHANWGLTVNLGSVLIRIAVPCSRVSSWAEWSSSPSLRLCPFQLNLVCTRWRSLGSPRQLAWSPWTVRAISLWLRSGRTAELLACLTEEYHWSAGLLVLTTGKLFNFVTRWMMFITTRSKFQKTV